MFNKIKLKKLLSDVTLIDFNKSALTSEYAESLHKQSHIRVGCSAFAIIGDDFVDMLAGGKKVRMLPDNELGPHLRLITSARIETSKDIKVVLQSILHYRLIRILLFPEEVMSRCTLVIATEEDQFLKRTGRLRKIGRPIMWVIFSQKELEEKALSIIMLLSTEFEHLDTVNSYVTVLKSLGVCGQRQLLKQNGIFMGHVDLILEGLANTVASFDQVRDAPNTNGFDKEAASCSNVNGSSSSQDSCDYRDHLIELCKLEVEDLKQQLAAKHCCEVKDLHKFYGSLISDSSLSKESISTVTDESLNKKRSQLKKLKKRENYQAKINITKSDRSIDNGFMRTGLNLFKKQIERAEHEIEHVNDSIRNEKQRKYAIINESYKIYQPKLIEYIKMNFHYNYIKTIETNGINDNSFRKILKKCLYWDEKQSDWVMKQSTTKICHSIINCLNKGPNKKPIGMIDAFRIFVKWNVDRIKHKNFNATKRKLKICGNKADGYIFTEKLNARRNR